MSEAEEAWRLWHLLQNLSALLLDHYESAFMDFCGEEKNCTGCFVFMSEATLEADDLPF